MSAKTLRRCLLLLALGVPLLIASPAGADVPEGWEHQPEKVDPLHALLVLGGIPLLLIALISLAVYLPALIHGERVAPGHHPELESHWFGGPRRGAAELESAESSGQSSSQSQDGESGGGSGTW